MLLENFIKYVKIDTQSDDNSFLTPSTKKQYDLLNVLKFQLDELCVKNELDEYGRLYGFVPGNDKLTKIGLCAHVDTASECSGKDVKPQIIKNYDLSNIKLGNSGASLSPKEYEDLEKQKGNTIITTDGTTLLGADDKAGVAIIMEIVSKILTLKIEDRHPLYILFTPDEEIGRGPEHFNVSKFACDYAYTFDGSSYNELSYENFYAKCIDIDIKGRSIHPGDAYHKMENSTLILSELISSLPSDYIPYNSKNHEGFIHITDIHGEVEHSSLHMIIRGFDKEEMTSHIREIESIKDKLSKKYKCSVIDMNVRDQYENMYEVIKNKPECVNHIKEVFKKMNITPAIKPIRGGTDGATFSFKGVPTPNLGTGSYNHHSRFEFAVLEEMEKLVEIGVNLLKK